MNQQIAHQRVDQGAEAEKERNGNIGKIKEKRKIYIMH